MSEQELTGEAAAAAEPKEAVAAGGELTVEATGETVGEAKWVALRELEKRAPGIDKATVRFQVLSEGERGLLGIGFAPARVIATVAAAARVELSESREGESDDGRHAREIVERIAASIGIPCRMSVDESDAEIVIECSGGDLGILIGRHGQTIDAIQYLVNAIVYKDRYEERKSIVVDAAGYRERRRDALHAVAVRAAERVVATGTRVPLDPMTAVERKVVHERLKEYPGVETSSEGTEPNRYVVVFGS
jgi:spoIIIJ-associated protein